MKITIVSGPTRGGKSKWAEELLKHSNNVIYIATAVNAIKDIKWKERIIMHQKRRNPSWTTIESNNDLSESIKQLDSKKPILIDSLGGFVSSQIELSDNDWHIVESKFINSLIQFNGNVTIVAEEVGWGLVSEYEIGNTFVDRLGTITQKIEDLATDSWLVLHGRAINIKELGIKITDA